MSFAPENEASIVTSLARISLMLQLNLMNQKPLGIPSESGLWDFIQDLDWFTENYTSGTLLKNYASYQNVIKNYKDKMESK